MEWMHNGRPSNNPAKLTDTQTRRYKWGKLTLRANMAEAGDYLRYAVDDEPMSVSHISVAECRHSWDEAFRLMHGWLQGQAG